MTNAPEDRNGHDGNRIPPSLRPSTLPTDLREWDGGTVIDLRADLGDPPVPEAVSWDLSWPALERPQPPVALAHVFDPLTDPLPELVLELVPELVSELVSEANAQPLAGPETRPETRPETQPERRLERRLETQPETRPETPPLPVHEPAAAAAGPPHVAGRTRARSRPRLTADSLVPTRRDRPVPPPPRVQRIFHRPPQPAPPPAPLDARQRELIEAIRTPLPDGHCLAVVSLKGGVGKTTVTALLGAALATHRIDRVVAIDANPDRGTLAEKVERTTQMTVRDLITAAPGLTRFSAVQRYVHQTSSRLDIVASESDPAASHALDEDDYSTVLDLLERYYNLILTDCGTGLLHAATQAALAEADSLVVVSSSSIDGARSAAATLDWLEAHYRGELASNAVALINESRADSDARDLLRIEDHFASRCRAVERIPYDAHLAAGTVVDLDALQPATLAAFRSVAAAVVAGAAAPAFPR